MVFDLHEAIPHILILDTKAIHANRSKVNMSEDFPLLSLACHLVRIGNSIMSGQFGMYMSKVQDRI